MEGCVLKDAKIGTRQGFEPQTYRLLWGIFWGFLERAATGSKAYPATMVLIESDIDYVSIIKKFLKNSGWKYPNM
jgi:hypothetical protein